MRCNASSSCGHRHGLAGQRGFSLIEILIAMTVTIIGLAGLLSLHLTTVRGNSRATRTVMASAIAQQTMDELRSLPVRAPTATYAEPTLQSAYGIPANEVLIVPDLLGPDNTTYQRVVSINPLGGPPLDNLVLVRVEIRWADEGAAADTTNRRYSHSVVLETVRTLQDVL